MIARYIFDYKYPTLNEYINKCRTHWASGAKMKEESDYATVLLLRLQKAKPIDEYPIDIVVKWHCKDKRKDVDNIHSSIKFILDGMQKAGIIRGDGRKDIGQIYQQIIDDGKEYTEVYAYKKGEVSINERTDIQRNP